MEPEYATGIAILKPRTEYGIRNRNTKTWNGILGTPRNSPKRSVYDIDTIQNSLNQPETARNTQDGRETTRNGPKQPAWNSQPEKALKH